MGKLIDIDVDRVDGVDTPATRRAFILRKSAVVDDPVKEDEASTEDEAAFHENVRALANSASAVLKALHDSGDEVPLTEDMANLLNTMSKSLGVEFDFKATKAKPKLPPDDEDNPDAEAEATDATADDGSDEEPDDDPDDEETPTLKKPPKPAMKDVDEPLSAEAIGASVAEALAPMLQSLAKSQKAMSKEIKQLKDAAAEPTAAITKSQQVRRQPTVKTVAPTDLGDGVFTSVIFGNDR